MPATGPLSIDPPSPATEPPQRADLGVLFVHGIGEQAQCETLLQFGEPLLDWIRDWMHRDPRPGALVLTQTLRASLRAPLLQSGEPAHAGVSIGSAHGDEVHEQQWLFAEAWWGSQAVTPAVGEFTAWLLTRGPWTLLLHFNQWWMPPVRAPQTPDAPAARRAQRLWWFMRRSSAMLVRGAPITVLWMALSLLSTVLLLALGLIALVPVGKLRAMVYAVLRALTGVVGDAYLLIRSPIRAAAFETDTLRSMHWLRDRCHRLAVVAHSQGSAIAHAALRHPDAPQAEAFVTVGSGIAKLRALAFFERCSGIDRIAPLLATPLALLAAFAWVRLGALATVEVPMGPAEAKGGPALLSLIALVMLLATWGSVRNALAALREGSTALSLAEAQPGLRWCDIVASHDPVPAGKLTQFFDPMRIGVHPEQVTVLRSWFADHTNYWHSRASFLPLLARELDHCAGNALLGIASADARLRSTTAWHKIDVRVLKAAKWLETVAIALPFLFNGGVLHAAVGKLHDWLEPSKLGDGGEFYFAGSTLKSLEGWPLALMDSALATSVALVKWLSYLLTGSALAHSTAVRFGELAAAFIVLVLALVAWRKLAHGLWQAWSSARYAEALSAASTVGETRGAPSDTEGLAQWGKQVPARVFTWVRDGLLFLVLMVPLVLSALATWFLPALNERNFWAIPGWLFAVLLTAMVLAAWLSDAADKIDAAQRWLREHPMRGIPDWPTVYTLVMKLALVVGGLGFAALMVAANVGSKRSSDISVGVFGTAMWFGIFLYALNGIWQRSRSAGVSRRWCGIWLVMPAACGIGGAMWLGMEAGRISDLRTLALVAFALAMLTALVERVALGLWARRRSQ
jgi:hypothetical protein